LIGGGPSSLPNAGFKSSQAVVEEELMLFRLIDLQQQPTSTVTSATTAAGSGSASAATGNAVISPSPSASNFTAVFREPLTATSILNFG